MFYCKHDCIGQQYLVDVEASSTKSTSSGHGLRVHFKRFPKRPPNSEITYYELDLSGWIAPRHRNSLTLLLQRHGVPLAALNAFIDLIFGVRFLLVNNIKAHVLITTFHEPYDCEVIEETALIGVLSDDELKKVTINGSESTTSCAICLNEFVLGSVATKMQCSHVFHEDCILKWFHKKYDCPLCRCQLPSAS